MDWVSVEALAQQWRLQGRAHAAAINDYVARGTHDGWDTVGTAPHDPRGPLAKEVLHIVYEANTADDIGTLREQFPPAIEPFREMLPQESVPIGPLLLLDDGQLLVRVGSHGVYRLHNLTWDRLSGVAAVGRSPDRSLFARARRRSGHRPKLGWPDHPHVALADRPRGHPAGREC